MREGGCFTEVTTLFRKNSFYFAEHLFSDRSQMTSNVIRKKKVSQMTSYVIRKKKWLMRYYRISLMLLYFDMFCDLLLNRAVAIWKHFVL